MRKISLLIFSCVLLSMMAGCGKDNPKGESFTSDERLAGETVTAGEPSSTHSKLFVLNEGAMGQNNASLDFLRFRDGKYVKNSFSLMNPDIAARLGDTGNDIAINGDEAWIIMNGSNLVEVISARNETHVATIEVPSPRNIAFHDGFAYVSSYAGAYYGGPDKTGAVYRVDTKAKRVTGKVEVGRQPEGLAVSGEKLYVANSGGFSSQGYEKSLSVIDLASFTVSGSVEMPTLVNLKDVVSDHDGNLWVSGMGDYYSVHSGIAKVNTGNGEVTEIPGARRATNICVSGNTVMVVGAENEWDYNASVKEYCLYSVDTKSLGVSKRSLAGTPLADIKTAYSILVNPDSGDIYVGDARDYISPGTLWCFSKDLSLKWKAVTGLTPGHLTLY